MDKVMEDVKIIFKDVFDDETLEVNEKSCADNVEDWDSLAQMNLIVAMEKHFQVHFSVEEIVKLKNVGEMVKLIESRLM